MLFAEDRSCTKTEKERAGEAILGTHFHFLIPNCFSGWTPATFSVQSPDPSEETWLFLFTITILKHYHKANRDSSAIVSCKSSGIKRKSQVAGNTLSKANACFDLYIELSRMCFEKKTGKMNIIVL